MRSSSFCNSRSTMSSMRFSVSKRGDGSALMFQDAKTHPPHQLVALDQVLRRRIVVAGHDHRGMFFVFLLQATQQLRTDAKFAGHDRQRLQGGFGADAAGQLQFVTARDIFRQPGPANDGAAG